MEIFEGESSDTTPGPFGWMVEPGEERVRVRCGALVGIVLGCVYPPSLDAVCPWCVVHRGFTVGDRGREVLVKETERRV